MNKVSAEAMAKFLKGVQENVGKNVIATEIGLVDNREMADAMLEARDYGYIDGGGHTEYGRGKVTVFTDDIRVMAAGTRFLKENDVAL
ncbi:YjcQ family protein [Exiguobacterium sp. SL14]|nr:YjcQ family protein [Exiguobacterium sp. SL14]MCY1690722.1 YjcQ family protein [Exiguobacterium sp. SL14]